MATYEETKDETVTLITYSPTAELGASPLEAGVTLPTYAVDQDYYTVQNVAGAFLYDASGPTWTDYTVEANDPAAGDVPLVPAPEDPGDGFIVGAATKYDFVTFEIGTVATGSGTFKYYYWNGSVWDELVVPDDLVYETLNHWQTIDLVRLTLKIQPADWVARTIGGKSCCYLFFKMDAGNVAVQPLADQIWTGVYSYAWTGDWSDSLALSDSAALVFDFGKNMSENMAISDTNQLQWDAALNFSDIMAISDSEAGAFAWTFPKDWSELMTISDSYVMSVLKNVTDTLSMTDSLLKSLPKVWADNITMSDSFAKQMSKPFADLMTIIGVLHIGNFVLFSDQVSISDALVKQVGKVFADTVTISSVLVYQVGKNVSENMSLADVFTLGTGVMWQDQIAIADDLYKSLFIGEPEPQMVGTLVSPHLQVLPWMPYVAIGTSNLKEEDVVGNITTLMEEVYRKQGTVRVVANTYFVRAEFGQDEPTADDLTIYEIGIFDQATGGNMAHRWVLDTGSAKDNIDEIVVECAITILHGEMLTHLLSFTGEAGAEMLASILAAGGSSVAAAKDSQPISDTLTWKLN